MEILALIPARGGSKGIPRKNLVALGGRSLVAHSVKHARACESVTRTIVSTDDPDIRDAAIAAGAEVPFLRPSDLAQDDTRDIAVFVHVLDQLQTTENYKPDLIVHLRPTAPLRRPEWITSAIEQLRSRQEVDSIRSVSKVAQHPYRMFYKNASGCLDPIIAAGRIKPYEIRRQDLPDVYYYNCVLDVTRRETIQVKGSMAGDNILAYVMNPDDVVDIDSVRDLELAARLLSQFDVPRVP